MTKRTVSRSILVGMLVSTFAVGFLCGSLNQRSADAQMENLGGAAIKQALGSGALGSVGELGSSIVEMQDHVSGLQKNIRYLEKSAVSTGEQVESTCGLSLPGKGHFR